MNRRPPLKPEGLGLMAIERAAIDLAGARRLLDEAFDQLLEIAGTRNPFMADVVSIVMAALLPVVERVEPDRLEERLWQAAAVGAPLPVPVHLQSLRPPVILAMLVSRYDRAMAAAIIAPALEWLPGALADASGIYYNHPSIIKALAAYDPRAVAALLRALPESARKPPARRDDWNAASLDAQVRIEAAEVLGWPVEERLRLILEKDQELRRFGQVR